MKTLLAKRIAAALLALLLAASLLPLTVAADVFTESPEQFEEPGIDGVTFDPPIEGGALILTSYHNRASLPPELQIMMENAANSIRNADHVLDLAPGIEAMARAAGVVNMDDLAVSELFDLRATVDDWGTATVTIHSRRFEPFVCLLHYTSNGWVIVDKCREDHETMTFTVTEFSPFAVVINRGQTASPQTSDTLSSTASALLTGGVLLATAALALLIKTRRKEED